jgi:hypothetical protein
VQLAHCAIEIKLLYFPLGHVWQWFCVVVSKQDPVYSIPIGQSLHFEQVTSLSGPHNLETYQPSEFLHGLYCRLVHCSQLHWVVDLSL